MSDEKATPDKAAGQNIITHMREARIEGRQAPTTTGGDPFSPLPAGEPVNLEAAREKRAAEIMDEGDPTAKPQVVIANIGDEDDPEAGQPDQVQPGTIQLNIDELFATIGAKTYESDKLRQQNTQLYQEILKLKNEVRNLKGTIRNLVSRKPAG